ncbi:hypothetical protein [uncultured Sphingomonas sp.]|uniref:hypothetical protein n=1 Tax=uncultured Sphingomonas sp. TaxID=158754 RepID=UPI0035CC8609
MRGGIWVLGFFAALWSIAGILVEGLSPAWAVLPVAVSVGLLVWASRQSYPDEGGSARNVGRLVGIWSAIQGVAMFVTANVLVNMDRFWAVIPACVIIVGLHFLPLARGIPVRLYYATGAAMIAIGTIALVAPAWHLPLATGLGASIVLWLSVIGLVRQAR